MLLAQRFRGHDLLPVEARRLLLRRPDSTHLHPRSLLRIMLELAVPFSDSFLGFQEVKGVQVDLLVELSSDSSSSLSMSSDDRESVNDFLAPGQYAALPYIRVPQD